EALKFGRRERGVESDVLASSEPRAAGRPAINAGGSNRVEEDSIRADIPVSDRGPSTLVRGKSTHHRSHGGDGAPGRIVLPFSHRCCFHGRDSTDTLTVSHSVCCSRNHKLSSRAAERQI